MNLLSKICAVLAQNNRYFCKVGLDQRSCRFIFLSLQDDSLKKANDAL